MIVTLEVQMMFRCMMSLPVQAFKNASEERIFLTVLAVLGKFVWDVIAVDCSVAPQIIPNASPLVCTEAQTWCSAVVAKISVLVWKVSEPVEDEVVRSVKKSITVGITIAHLKKSDNENNKKWLLLMISSIIYHDRYKLTSVSSITSPFLHWKAIEVWNQR